MCHALFGIYTERVFITYLGFKFTWNPMFFFADVATLAEAGDSATLQHQGVLQTAWGSGGAGWKGWAAEIRASMGSPPLSGLVMTGPHGSQAIYP